MGAKVAMVLALQFPSLIRDIVSVDNAPIENSLSRSFNLFIEGMKKVEQEEITRQSEAENILRKYVEVSKTSCTNPEDARFIIHSYS